MRINNNKQIHVLLPCYAIWLDHGTLRDSNLRNLISQEIYRTNLLRFLLLKNEIVNSESRMIESSKERNCRMIVELLLSLNVTVRFGVTPFGKHCDKDTAGGL